MMDERRRDTSQGEKGPVTIFGPDFPFPFDDWIAHPAGLGSIPARNVTAKRSPSSVLASPAWSLRTS